MGAAQPARPRSRGAAWPASATGAASAASVLRNARARRGVSSTGNAAIAAATSSSSSATQITSALALLPGRREGPAQHALGAARARRRSGRTCPPALSWTSRAAASASPGRALRITGSTPARLRSAPGLSWACARKSPDEDREAHPLPPPGTLGGAGRVPPGRGACPPSCGTARSRRSPPTSASRSSTWSPAGPATRLIGLGLLFFLPVLVVHRPQPGEPPVSAQPQRLRRLGREPVPAGRDPRQPGCSGHGTAPDPAASRLASPAMARLPDPQDPLFRALNSSVGFDFRLAPQDIRGLAGPRPDARPAGDHRRRGPGGDRARPGRGARGGRAGPLRGPRARRGRAHGRSSAA